MHTETSVEANLSSEYVNHNAITVPLPAGDEDFTKKKIDKLLAKKGRNFSSELVSKQVTKDQFSFFHFTDKIPNEEGLLIVS